jgi:transcriptional regulator with XRE-family HTH domain
MYGRTWNYNGGTYMIISERIFYIMEQKNMSQLELSRRTGIATSNISDWKKKKTNPKADCLLSICDALDITPEQLLTGKGIDPEYKDPDSEKCSPLFSYYRTHPKSGRRSE